LRQHGASDCGAYQSDRPLARHRLQKVDLQCALLYLGQRNFRGDLADRLRLQGQ
jgi:hypothetical protein